MTTKLRQRILTKLAQTTPTDNVSGATTVAEPSMTMEALYPNIRSGYDSAHAVLVYAIGNLLNRSLNVSTSGKYTAQTLRSKSWAISPDDFPDPGQKSLAMFFKKVFSTLFNNGNTFLQPLSAQQLSAKTTELLQSQEFRNLSQVNPTGPIATKITNNLQGQISDLLRRLGPTIPT